MRFSKDILAKARTLSAGRTAGGSPLVVRDGAYPNIWWVTSLSGEHTYRVQNDFDPAKGTITWVSCTCMHGLNVDDIGRTSCHHAAAVLMRLLEESQARTARDLLNET